MIHSLINRFGLYAAAVVLAAVLVVSLAFDRPSVVSAAPRPCPEITKLVTVSYQTTGFSYNTMSWGTSGRTPYNQAYLIERSDDYGVTWVPFETVNRTNRSWLYAFGDNVLLRVSAVTSVYAPCVGATTPRVFDPAPLNSGAPQMTNRTYY